MGRWPLEDLSPSDSGLPPCHNFFEIGGLEREDDHPILHARWRRIRSHARRLQEGMRHLRGHAARMRLSVRACRQNASFRRVRFSSPGQTRRRLTEKRSLGRATHVKAHSVRRISRKGALCMRVVTQTAPFRHVARPPFWLLRETRSKSALPAEKPSCLQRDFLSFGGRLWARSWVRSARAVSRCRRNAYRSKGRPDLHCQTP